MGIGQVLSDFFLRGAPSSDVVKDDDAARGYKEMKSIAGYMPYLDTVEDNKILLSDGRSVAAVYSLTSIPTEARSDELMEQFAKGLNQFICNTFEEDATAPWTVSFYCWNDRAGFYDLVEETYDYARRVHAARDAQLDPYTHWFMNNLWEPHIKTMMAGKGLFTDSLSDMPWAGKRRRAYLVFYRRQSGAVRRRNWSANTELDNQCKKVEQMIRGAGIKCQRLGGEAIHNWLFRWFNPRPKSTGGDTEALLKQFPYIPEEHRTAEYDLATDVMTSDVRTCSKTKHWYFDGMPHTVLSIEKLEAVPAVGQTSAERYRSKEERASASAKTTCMLDQLPDGTVLVITYVAKQQQMIRKHLERLEKNSRGDTPEAGAAREEVRHARLQIARGNKLYPYSMGLCVRGDDDDHIDDVIRRANTVLTGNSFKIIDPDYDLFRQDRYMRFIPCGFDLANLLPVYGRGLGSGNHGIVFFNRGAEPLSFDPTWPGDRVKNAHLFLFGPTGAGKSATLVYLQMLITAVINPRWVVVEAGNSFGLLSDFLKRMGKSVVDIKLKPGKDCPSIAPFKALLQLVDAKGRVIQEASEVEEILNGDAELSEADDGSLGDVNESEVTRDVLGEMLIIARLMVTGGELKEEHRMTRADLGILKRALLDAAVEARLAGLEDVLPERVIKTLRNQTIEKPDNALRINEMADAMELFCDGFAGQLFNRPGEELPDADYIRIEMGSLASGNDTGDKLAVAYISIINQVIARAQRTQRDGRPTINLTDEAHVITKNPLLAMYLVVVSKLLGRRMGLWLWQATQNMEDYKDESKKMLAMFEWWLCLKVEAGELKHIEENRSLSDDQKTMLLSTRKEPKKYTEGVVMSDSIQGLFRVIQPPLCLALAGTEKEEKRERQKVMQEFKCDEVDAAIRIGEMIGKKRLEHANSL
jgi:conjugative transfer ATPase